MAELSQRVEVKHNEGLRCPVCEEDIPVIAVVSIDGGGTRHAGSAGFGKPIINTTILTKILSFKFSHECEYKYPHLEED